MKKRYIRSFVFTKTPLKKSFRYKDVFQIYPLSYPLSPKNSHSRDFPVIIEYWVDEDKNPKVEEEEGVLKRWLEEFGNQIVSKKIIFYLLTAITNHRFFEYIAGSGSWTMEVPETITPETDKISSKWCLNMYHYAELPQDFMIDSFTAPAYPVIEKIPHQLYYQFEPVEDIKAEITFPETISRILDNYFSLRNDERQTVDSCISLINGGVQIESELRSLSLISFISAIETLVNFEYKNENSGIEFECTDCQTLKKSPFQCKKCGKPIWGINHKYREFLKTYIDSRTGSQKKFKNYYNLRSNITHKGLLLIGDNQLDWGNFKSAESESLTRLEIKQLAKLCLVNWLLSRNPV